MMQLSDPSNANNPDILVLLTTRVRLFTGEDEIGTGTAFFHLVEREDKERTTLLVSNKHVFSDADKAIFQLRRHSDDRSKKYGETFDCSIDLHDATVIWHHNDETDLCAVVIDSHIKNATNRGDKLLFTATNPFSRPPSETWGALKAIEDVIMIGYPNGLFDHVNSLPIVRKGITATPVWADYQGREEFMVDMACFPGSSGSPVFAHTHAYAFNEVGDRTVLVQSFLIGILYAGPIATSTGRIILGVEPTVEIDSMMHLGQVVRSTALAPLEQAALELLTQRDCQ
jgi:hypothetical protein